MIKWKDYILPTLIALCALAVSASAAFYSVSGLAKLFAGASLQVMVMAGSLEVAKLVIATLLHQYWNTLNKLLRVYLTLSIVVLVIITSMGIYGFLSSAYQNTAVGFETASKEVAFLKQKEAFYQKDLDRLDTELARISDNISELSKAKAREVSVSDGRGGVNTAISTTELRLADSRIKVEETNRATTLASRNIVADSLKNIQTKILKLEVEASSNAELGPLIYLSELTGRPMDEIINILLLVIIFVFDPLAISLVLAANFAFAKIKQPYPKPIQEIKQVLASPKIDKKRKKRKKKVKMNLKQEFEEKYNKPDVKENIISEEEKTIEDVVIQEEIKEENKQVNDIPLNVVTKPVEVLEPSEHILSPEIDFTYEEIVKVLQKTPTFYAILLRNGKRTRISKEDFTELQRISNSE